MTASPMAPAQPKVIVKDRVWPKLRYRPNEAQVKIHNSVARNRVAAAGRRIGKSTCGGHELIPEAYRAYFNKGRLEEEGKRAEYWIVGPTYTDSEKEFRTFTSSEDLADAIRFVVGDAAAKMNGKRLSLHP